LPDGSVGTTASEAGELQWTLRYGDPTREQLLAAASVLQEYWHLVAHPVGTEAVIRTLRMLRRAEAAS